MTKSELIQALSTFPDDATIMGAHPNQDGTSTLDDIASVRRGELSGGLAGHPMLYELDLATGSCRERRLSDRPAEFPRIDDRLVGRRNRFGYVATGLK